MYTGKLVFSQVMEHLPLHVFHQCVSRYSGDFKVKEFTCLDQYLCMAFAQLTYRESLRDIEACLRSQQNKLYHMGIRSSVSRNTLANANKVRDWRIYADLAYSLIQTARKLYVNDSFGLELQNTVFRNGIVLTVDFGIRLADRALLLSAFAVDTRFTGDAVYIQNYQEFGVFGQ